VIVDILAKMGAEVRWVEDGVLVKGGKLKAINIDLGDTPDLLPTVTALACLAEGTTIIRNVEHARYKETDRISACAKEFRKFGVRIEEKEDGLVIHGKESLAGAIVKSYGDHRMAMALAIAGLSAEGKTIVKDIDCVRISFPAFFNMVRDLAPWGSSLIR
jgi:3-phosphoshikimate 1-carboxyvinyltransferase